MASKRPRSDSPEVSSSRPRRKVTEPGPPPPVPYEDSIFSVQTDVSESTRAANLAAMLDRIDRYATSAERPHDEILQASLRNFLEMLPPDGCAELLKDQVVILIVLPSVRLPSSERTIKEGKLSYS
ncbi:hypothetical protein N7457_009532 [Penicillium paradoxum]|uniref:uncharacterized protein n=1 Tax=Penicillium paradoxum TaxID=176176 RepID=UPI0025476461|nr:uncharacterized protein N7457_009532 [Penicillium paradoxum]KAJ5774636.1 hypothetical protein N7457_009532 [Penicillium paradoxum]